MVIDWRLSINDMNKKQNVIDILTTNFARCINRAEMSNPYMVICKIL